MNRCEGAFRTITIALLVSIIGILLAFRFVSGSVLVKGNGSSMIYHTRQCASYAATIIGNDAGDRYFLSEVAAKDAGYRKAKNCYH
jgi:hypothetical protein